MPSQRTVLVRVTPWRALLVWRDIELRLDQTLHDLHLAIQEAFELDNEHLYAFYMNGNPFDLEFGYEGSPDDARPSAQAALLDQFALPINKRFLYLFDFGDELRHHVKVLAHGTASVGVAYPRIVAKEGEAPLQYEEWGDEDEYENTSPSEKESENSKGEKEPLELVSEPIRQRLAELVPRIERAIERREDRMLGENSSEAQWRVELTEDHTLACELCDLATSDTLAIHAAIEDATSYSVWDWLRDLREDLSDASMHEQALDLARRSQAVDASEEVQIELPQLLQRTNHAQEARVALAQNLIEFPEDARVHWGAAEIELAAGNFAQAEFHYREALKWVGTQRRLREPIREGLKELLRITNQTAELQTLAQQEEAYIRRVYPGVHAHTPIRRQTPKVGRNDPCPCGSGKKSKKCCGANQ